MTMKNEIPTKTVISRLANFIGRQLENVSIFTKLAPGGLDKRVTRDEFYIKMQNIIYHSLNDFVNGDEVGDTTLIFINRIAECGLCYNSFDTAIMKDYRKIFTDHWGLELLWLVKFESRLTGKFKISASNAQIILKEIGQNWCQNPMVKPVVESPKVIQLPQQPEEEQEQEIEFVQIPSDENMSHEEDADTSSDVCIYKRGQLWHWEDPVYDKKGEGYRIESGEASLRYSRYVLIVQNVDHSVPKTVSVIPLTTLEDPNDDIRIRVYDNKRQSVVKCRHIMPVSVKCLSRYIGTVHTSKMREIDERISQIYLPKQTPAAVVKEEVVEEPVTIAPITEAIVEEKPEQVAEIQEEIVEPIQRHSGGPKKFWTMERINEFIIFYELNGVEKAALRYGISVYTATNYYEKWLKNPPSPPVAKKAKNANWDNKTRRDFISSYLKYGVEKTASEYGLTLSTASTYYYEFKRKLDVAM